MDTLSQQVRRAQRRLWWQAFFVHLSWSWFATLLLAALAIGWQKLWPVEGITAAQWAAGAVLSALGLGLLGAVAWTWIRRQDTLDAAIELDRRFGLKERVSSALSLSPDQHQEAASKALLADAVHRVSSIEVRERFGFQFQRKMALPLAPAALAFVLAMFVNERGQENQLTARTETAPEVKTAAEQLQKKLEKKREKLKAFDGLKDLEGELDKLENGTRELAKKDSKDRKKALVKLNDLAKEMEKRRQNLAQNSQKLQEQLSQLRMMQQGPAEKLAQAMRKGNFKAALNELEKLKEQLKNGSMSEEQQAQMGQQLAAMQQKLQEMAQAHKQTMENMRQEIKRLRDSGQMEQASKLQQKLANLESQMPQIDKMQQLAEKLGQCSECLSSGNSAAAMEALNALGEDLDSLMQQMDEMEMLDAVLDDISMAKNAMNCSACQGSGCSTCQGLGNMFGSGMGGNGLGAGQGGMGDRPEERTNTSSYDSQVSQNVRKGRHIVAGEAEGPNLKGQVLEGIKAEYEASANEAADPLTGQKLSKTQRQHAKQYFDLFREGSQ